MLTDASAARGAIENGGQNMKYMNNTPRISNSWLRDACDTNKVAIEAVHTTVNCADLGTKFLQQPMLSELGLLFGLRKPGSLEAD